MNRLRYVWYGLLLVPLIFFAAFFLYPLGNIFYLSLTADGAWDFSGFARIFTSSYYLNTFIFTFWQALLSTALTVALALPGAYVFVRFSFPGKSILLSLSMLPFVLPTVVVGAAFLALIGPTGIINEWLMRIFSLSEAPIRLEGTLAIVLIAHVFYNYAVAMRIIVSYWMAQSAQIEDAARMLGAHGWTLWWKIWFPILRPAILAASALVFIFTFTSFGVVLLLGGIRFATVEVQIYYQALNVFNLPVAAALSLLQIGIIFILMAFYARLQERVTQAGFQRQISRAPRTLWEKVFLIVNTGFILLFLMVPLLALMVKSVWHDNEFTLRYYQLLSENTRGSVLFTAPIHAIWNSVQYALLTTALSTALGLLSAYLINRKGALTAVTRWLDPLLMLPLATSAVTLGFGFLVSLDRPPLDLRSSPLIIPIAHSLVAVPLVTRSILPAIRSIPPNIQEAAATLGANPLRKWIHVDFPLISRAAAVGATFAFTVSLGEFGASLFVARQDSTTIPLVIYRLLGQPGNSNYGQAMAMSTILLISCAVAFLTIEYLRQSGSGER